LAFDRGAARKGTGVLDVANGGAVRAWIFGLIAHQPHLSAAHVRTLCRSEFGDTITVKDKAVPMPPLRTFQAALKALKEAEKVVLTKLTDPDRFRSHMQLSGTGSLRHIGEPNQLWQIDASPVDALCTDGRHSIYVCIDIATRRGVFYMSRTPRAEAVGLLLRKAIMAWGVPAEIKTDNGSDFVAKSTQRLLASLGIAAITSDAFSPEQKGHVERLIKTFQHDAATLLPGFVGHSVADRKAIEGRRSFAQRLGADDAATFAVQLTAAEMQAHVDAWAELSYERRDLGRRCPL
jgi:putative transposase